MPKPDLSIVMLAFNEAKNLKELIPQIKAVLDPLSLEYEILILDGNSKDNTVSVVKSLGCRIVMQNNPGYGSAFKQAMQEAKGFYTITLDADCSHTPEFIKNLWEKRECSPLVLASRYIKGGSADMPIFKRFLSIFLNRVYSIVLALPYNDLSSGFRLYRMDSVRDILDQLSSRDFDVLLELLLKMYCRGFEITEVPFYYQSRHYGKSTIRIWKFAISYLKTLYHLWQIRNSNSSADYDSRAFNSIIPLQRYWQRKRYKIIFDLIEGRGSCLDIGCGSSRIIQNLPHAVAMDMDLNKLRFLKKSNRMLINADIYNLPFKDKVFSEIICSEVIEHVSKDHVDLKEFRRVLTDGGILIIGTPDYANFWWNFFEWFYAKILPNAYAQGHIAHYTKVELLRILKENDFEILEHHYICGGELIIKAKKL